MIKKITLLLFLIFIGFGFIGNAQRAYFVNTKDSGTHVFWSDWVKSMNVSKIDMDSVKCAEFVTQEIWTCDTVVRFPLESIESITFEAPSTIYQPGVERLEEKLWDHITGYDEERNIISVDKDMDAKLLPTPGTKLCTTQLTEIFPIGFIGEVKDIVKGDEAIEIHCESVELTDIFKRYYSGYEEARQKMAASDGDPFKAPPLTGEKDLKFGPVEVPLLDLLPVEPSYKFDEENSLGFYVGDSYAGVTFETNYKLRAYMIVDENCNVPVYMTLSGLGNHILTGRLDMYGHLNYSWSKALLKTPSIRILAFADVTFEAGPFLDANFDAGYEISSRTEFNSAFRMIYSSEGAENEALPVQSPTFKLVSNEWKLNSLNFSGQVTLGGYFKANASLVKKEMVSAYLGLKGGIRYTADYTIPKSQISEAYKTPSFYESMKDVGGAISLVVFPELGVVVFDNSKWELGIPLDLPVLVDKELFKMQLFPTFSNLKATRNHLPESSADLSFDVSGFSPYVYTIGGIASSLYDDNERRGLMYSDDFYTPTFSKKEYKFKLDLDNQFHRYKIAPVINVNGYDIMASPSIEVEEGVDIETLDAKEIGASSATLGGRVYNLENLRDLPIPLFYYSEKGKDNWTEVSDRYPTDQSDNFYTITGLKPETEYEYYFALQEYTNPYSAIVKDGIKIFKTKKEATCHVDFDFVYPICHHGCRFYPVSSPDDEKQGYCIRFSIATKPFEKDVDNGKIIKKQGTVIYKNGVEIARGELVSPDDDDYMGHSTASCLVYAPDLSIDSKNYIARADKAVYEVGMYFQFEKNNGEILNERSDIRKKVEFVYDTKPYFYTSYAEYGEMCHEEPVYDNGVFVGYEHKHKLKFRSLLWVGGTFWMHDDAPKDNPNDLVYTPVCDMDYIPIPTFEVEYNSETAPQKEYASFVDVNGVVHKSNVIPIYYTSDGHPEEGVIDNNGTPEHTKCINMSRQWPWMLKDETSLKEAQKSNNFDIPEIDSENNKIRVVRKN